MMGYFREHPIAATRKPHRCEACQTTIETGSAANYITVHDGSSDGPFYGHFHPDCRDAEVRLNDLHDWRGGDDWMALHEAEADDLPWIAEEFPAVFARVAARIAA